nr:KRAB-A domain-containing protein 2-like isoform X1 [Procambarus clarkii]
MEDTPTISSPLTCGQKQQERSDNNNTSVDEEPLPSSSTSLPLGQKVNEGREREEEVRQKKEFELKISQMLETDGHGSRKIFTRENLAQDIEVKNAKLKLTTKTSHEYDLLSRYDVKNLFGDDVLVTIDETERRMKRGTKRKLTSDNHHRHHSTTAVTTTTTTTTGTADPGRMCRRFIHQGQLYDTIYDAHRAVCHGGEKRTYFEVSKTIANVTQQSVKLFISLCHICNLKRLPRRKKGVIRPIVSASFAERGQMDLINMQQEGGCV